VRGFPGFDNKKSMAPISVTLNIKAHEIPQYIITNGHRDGIPEVVLKLHLRIISQDSFDFSIETTRFHSTVKRWNAIVFGFQAFSSSIT